MKKSYVKIFIAIVFCTSSKTTFCQDLTSKDLYGIWDTKTLDNQTMTYNFKDDSTVLFDDPERKTFSCIYKFIVYQNMQLLGIEMTAPDNLRTLYKIAKKTTDELDLQLFEVESFNKSTKKWTGHLAPKILILKFKKRNP